MIKKNSFLFYFFSLDFSIYFDYLICLYAQIYYLSSNTPEHLFIFLKNILFFFNAEYFLYFIEEYFLYFIVEYSLYFIVEYSYNYDIRRSTKFLCIFYFHFQRRCIRFYWFLKTFIIFYQNFYLHNINLWYIP